MTLFLEENHVDPGYNPVIIMKKGTANISIALQSPVRTPTTQHRVPSPSLITGRSGVGSSYHAGLEPQFSVWMQSTLATKLLNVYKQN